MRLALTTAWTFVLGGAWASIGAGCALLGLGEVPCETDANCPAGQRCSAD